MKMMRRAILPALLITLAGGGAIQPVLARPDVQYGQRVVNVVNNLDSNFQRFQDKLDSQLDRSRLDGTSREDDINQVMKDFRRLTRDLRDTVNDNDRLEGQVRRVIDGGTRIQRFLDRHPRLASGVQYEWRAVRTNLDQLQNISSNRGGYYYRPNSGNWRY